MVRSLLPLYFPTNVVLLDDDTNFLKHFPLLLDPGLPCMSFSSATKALEHINNQESLLYTIAENSNVTAPDDTEELSYIDLKKLANLVYENDRFSQITVAIIDYDMPEMNGLEVCRHIQHKEIKKILLTGKADEKLAVEAFNDGLIHQFIQKGNADVDKHLNRAIEKLQIEYFTDITSPIHMALTEGSSAFLADSNLRLNLSKLIQDKNIIEFYLWKSPRGLLMLDDLGNTAFMFVMNEEVLQTHSDMAQACDAPGELLNKLKSGQHVPWFPTPDGYYSNDCQADWRNCLHEVNFTCGKLAKDHCSLVSPAPAGTLDGSKILPFQSYLQTFDNKNSKSR